MGTRQPTWEPTRRLTRKSTKALTRRPIRTRWTRMTVRRKTEKQYATESEYVHQWIRDPRVAPVGCSRDSQHATTFFAVFNVMYGATYSNVLRPLVIPVQKVKK